MNKNKVKSGLYFTSGTYGVRAIFVFPGEKIKTDNDISVLYSYYDFLDNAIYEFYNSPIWDSYAESLCKITDPKIINSLSSALNQYKEQCLEEAQRNIDLLSSLP